MAHRLLGAVALLAATAARADVAAPPPPPAALAALALPTDDDARHAVAIGVNGEVYAPDAKGTWTRTQRITTSKRIAHVGRAGEAIIAFGEGVVYRLAANGWSAIRLHQKERAVMSVGPRAVAAVGRQVFALDESAGGEPKKLVLAPSNVIALGTGTEGIVLQTDKGLFRVKAGRVVAVKAPPKVTRLVGDRWALVDDGAIDLETGRKTGWPPGTAVLAAAMTSDQRLALVTRQSGKLALAIVAKDKVERAPIDVPAATAIATPVGVVVDKAGRAVVALASGTLLVRASGGVWTTVAVSDALPGAKPGAPPARSR